jgi:hypothetical protein
MNMTRPSALFSAAVMLAVASLLVFSGCRPRSLRQNRPPVFTENTPPATPATPPAQPVPPTQPVPSSLPDAVTEPAPSDNDPRMVLQELANNYKNGEISRCTYQGATVYLCARNAPDAGSEVFDINGNKIGVCYYSTNRVDPVCKDAQGCKVIYRVSPNIWGKPGVALELD